MSASTSDDGVAARLDRDSERSLVQEQPVNADGLRDILDALFAEVLELKRQLFHDVIVDAA